VEILNRSTGRPAEGQKENTVSILAILSRRSFPDSLRLGGSPLLFFKKERLGASMPTEQKARTIEQAQEWYSNANGVIFTDYRGLKVKEMQALRKNLKAKGGEIHILKNTLLRRSIGDEIANLPEDLHNGPTAVAYVTGSEAECAKALVDYAATNKKFIVKGGYFGGRAFTAKDIVSLSKLPPRDVLIAQVIGAIAAPLSNLVGVIEALYADPIRTIGAVADKVAEGSPLPTPAPESAEAPAAEAPSSEAAPAE